jgi:hypothetical protein
MTSEHSQGRVVAALLDSGLARFCYQHDAEFRALVDSLAAVMVGMIDQLVDHSSERRRHKEQQILELMRRGPAVPGEDWVAAMEVVHRCPLVGEDATPCCGRTPLELPLYHRITRDDGLVTCQGARSSTGQPASGPAAQ